MNVSTITVSPQEAQVKLDAYRSLQAKQRTAEDRKLETLYKSVSKGARVIDARAAFRETGLNEKGQPRLALARADWEKVWCIPQTVNGEAQLRNLKFTGHGTWYSRASDLIVPTRIAGMASNSLTSPVPHVPASVRPRYKLENYHILFEVKEWTVYPVDPFLLRRISGMLFVVEAEWELTDLEAALLSSMREAT